MGRPALAESGGRGEIPRKVDYRVRAEEVILSREQIAGLVRLVLECGEKEEGDAYVSVRSGRVRFEEKRFRVQGGLTGSDGEGEESMLVLGIRYGGEEDAEGNRRTEHAISVSVEVRNSIVLVLNGVNGLDFGRFCMEWTKESS